MLCLRSCGPGWGPGATTRRWWGLVRRSEVRGHFLAIALWCCCIRDAIVVVWSGCFDLGADDSQRCLAYVFEGVRGHGGGPGDGALGRWGAVAAVHEDGIGGVAAEAMAPTEEVE